MHARRQRGGHLNNNYGVHHTMATINATTTNLNLNRPRLVHLDRSNTNQLLIEKTAYFPWEGRPHRLWYDADNYLSVAQRRASWTGTSVRAYSMLLLGRTSVHGGHSRKCRGISALRPGISSILLSSSIPDPCRSMPVVFHGRASGQRRCAACSLNGPSISDPVDRRPGLCRRRRARDLLVLPVSALI